MTEKYYIGIDVGTGSARAGIFDGGGVLAARASREILTWNPRVDFVQQSSENIWNAVCNSVKEALSVSGVDAAHIAGIGFDATCSLVVLGEGNKPLTVSPDQSEEQNIIVWMDHRAKKEAEEINKTGHEVLKYVGGVISPEMQTPKLLWLKRNMPETWKNVTGFFDLPDYLVYRATDTDVRSACTTTCKWTYLCHKESSREGSIGSWDDSYFREIGLADLVDDQYRRIGNLVRPMGEAVGQGLTEKSAREMGLNPETPVGISIIDAHAGGLGLLGMSLGDDTGFRNKIALIGGTSSCHMAVSEEAVFIDGVWGPYYSAMIPGMWLNEGGQSATGSLIDHVIFSSSLSQSLQDEAEKKSTTVYELLNNRLLDLARQKNLNDVGYLTQDLHVLPYFNGNRSPRANPSLSGAISGLRLSATLDDLALVYLATIQSIAYGTRHIIDTMNHSGYRIHQIVATGGGTRNPVFLQQHADISTCEIILGEEPEAVLLGSAVLGAVAAGSFDSVLQAMQRMNRPGIIIRPNEKMSEYHAAKYKVFHRMYDDQCSYKKLMEWN